MVLLNNRLKYFFSNLIIEEPEQNLFPETQRDFIYFLLERIQSAEKPHSVVITTHSPYILYAINNCILGKIIMENIEENERTEFKSYRSWINPEEVAIWEIDKNNGTLKSIKESEIGTVSEHYFNAITNDLMDEYYKMLSYLK
jgi:predicted ATPase